MEIDAVTILHLLFTGGIISAIITVLYNYLSSRRQFRQTLDQKMIERVSYLAECYYGQISRSCENLRNALNQALNKSAKETIVARYRESSFYHLISYLYNVEKLRQERPRPLFTEIEAEIYYAKQIQKIQSIIPFFYYEISCLLKCCVSKEGLISICKLIELVETNEDIKVYYKKFSEWLNTCNCGDKVEDASCLVHEVIKACYWISQTLEEQIQKMYYLWYKRPKKKPKIRIENEVEE